MHKIILTIIVAGGLCISSFGQTYIPMNLTQPDPLSAYAGPDTLVCKGHSVILGSNPTATGGMEGYIYLWSPPDGLDNPTSPNPVATLEESKSYMLSVTDENGCQAISFVNVYVDPCLGTHPVNMESSLTLYPNPSGGMITIRGISGIPGGIDRIQLYNQLGQVVFDKTFGANQIADDFSVDTGLREPGMYILKISMADRVISKRMIIR
jgi:hypothetical protein